MENIMSIVYKINKLKKELTSSDYQVLKFIEGWISEEDFAPIKDKRESLRVQIRDLEVEYKKAIKKIEESEEK